eukprot:5175848-Prymnesium_polylepis.1
MASSVAVDDDDAQNTSKHSTSWCHTGASTLLTKRRPKSREQAQSTCPVRSDVKSRTSRDFCARQDSLLIHCAHPFACVLVREVLQELGRIQRIVTRAQSAGVERDVIRLDNVGSGRAHVGALEATELRELRFRSVARKVSDALRERVCVRGRANHL